jgi:hypothetical protein
MCWKILVKLFNIKLHENIFIAFEFLQARQTAGGTDMAKQQKHFSVHFSVRRKVAHYYETWYKRYLAGGTPQYNF